MKNQIKFIVLALLICIIFAPSVLAEENENVFRDSSWRDEPDTFEVHSRVRDEETNDLEDKNYGLKIYRKRDEDLTLGSLELFDIHYYFFEDELIRIRLTFDFDEKDHARRMLEARYGETTAELPFPVRYKWKDHETEIILSSGFSFEGSLTYITFENIDLIEELEEWQDEQKQKRAEEDSQEW